MSVEMIFAAVFIVGIALAVAAKLVPVRKPPSPVFQCSRCGMSTRHTDRTEEAWSQGKTKFFCSSCHEKWLKSHPPRDLGRNAARGKGANSGCLGVIVMSALLPLGGLIYWTIA